MQRVLYMICVLLWSAPRAAASAQIAAEYLRTVTNQNGGGCQV